MANPSHLKYPIIPQSPVAAAWSLLAGTPGLPATIGAQRGASVVSESIPHACIPLKYGERSTVSMPTAPCQDGRHQKKATRNTGNLYADIEGARLLMELYQLQHLEVTDRLKSAVPTVACKWHEIAIGPTVNREIVERIIWACIIQRRQ